MALGGQVGRHLHRALRATRWREREAALCAAASHLADATNRAGALVRGRGGNAPSGEVSGAQPHDGPYWRDPAAPRIGFKAGERAISASWQQCDRLREADDGEVPPVEGRDGVRVEPFGDRENGGVDGADREVAVLFDQFDHPVEVLAIQWDQADLSGADGAQERGFGAGAFLPLSMKQTPVRTG